MLMTKIQCQENYRDFINKINIKVYFQVMFIFDDIYTNNKLHAVIHTLCCNFVENKKKTIQIHNIVYNGF